MVKRNARIDIAKPPIPNRLFLRTWFQNCAGGRCLRLSFYGVGSLSSPPARTSKSRVNPIIDATITKIVWSVRTAVKYGDENPHSPRTGRA